MGKFDKIRNLWKKFLISRKERAARNWNHLKGKKVLKNTLYFFCVSSAVCATGVLYAHYTSGHVKYTIEMCLQMYLCGVGLSYACVFEPKLREILINVGQTVFSAIVVAFGYQLFFLESAARFKVLVIGGMFSFAYIYLLAMLESPDSETAT